MNTINNKKLIGFAAYSGTGKTTLIKLIVKLLKELNLKVSVIKHAHHDFDVDKIGKDSYEIRKSGAVNMLISSANRWALMHENTNNSELSLNDLINILDPLDCDIILVEGFKAEKFPKGTRKILFDPCSHHLKEPNIERISHWDQLKTLLT